MCSSGGTFTFQKGGLLMVPFAVVEVGGASFSDLVIVSDKVSVEMASGV